MIDARAEAAYVGTGEVQTRRWTEKVGDNSTTYYAADVYRVDRSVAFTVDDLTIEGAADRAQFDGSTTNNIVNTVLPFDTKNAVKWNSSYLVGFTSEKRDLDVGELQPVLEDQLLSIGRSQVHESLVAVRPRRALGGRAGRRRRLALGRRCTCPVWLYSYYQENTKMLHYIAVNARTGETMGSVPVSQPRLILAALTVGTFLEGIAGADPGGRPHDRRHRSVDGDLGDGAPAVDPRGRTGRCRGDVLVALPLLPQHRQVARLRARHPHRGPAGAGRARRRSTTSPGPATPTSTATTARTTARGSSGSPDLGWTLTGWAHTG